MRKKLDTRFPAARIKKIMQADEDVGKIAMAVPLLVSKALELFLQDLCDRTYEITLKKEAKTLNSLHLKQCVHTFNIFDFLGEVVGKVPDLGGSGAASDDRGSAKRRKVADDEHNDSDEVSNRSKTHEPTPIGGGVRGRGRGRPRGCGRGGRASGKEKPVQYGKYEDDPDVDHHNGKARITTEGLDSNDEPEALKENSPAGKNPQTQVHEFDLNTDLDENGDSKAVLTAPHPSSLTISSTVAPGSSPKRPTHELKDEEFPGWSLAEIEKMDIDPIQLAHLNRRTDEDEEDYDEEG